MKQFFVVLWAFILLFATADKSYGVVTATADLQLWLKADSIQEGDVDSAGTVHTWKDSSIYQRNAPRYNGDPIFVPQALNNMPAISFNGWWSSFYVPASPVWSFTDFTIYSVVKINRNNNWWSGLWLATDAGPGPYPKWIMGTFSGSDFSFNTRNSYASGGAGFGFSLPSDQFGIFEMRKKGSTYSGYLNGQFLGSSNDNFTIPPLVPVPLTIGFAECVMDPHCRNDSAFKGEIAELMIYNSALDNNNRQDVGRYLAEKYNLPYSNTTGNPVAKIDGNTLVHVNDTVIISGNSSLDPEGDYPLTYKWTMASLPAGSQASLMGSDQVTCSFVVDVPGTYRVQLIVTNSKGEVSSPVETMVGASVTNGPEIFQGSGLHTGGFEVYNSLGMLQLDYQSTGTMYQNTFDYSSYPGTEEGHGGGIVALKPDVAARIIKHAAGWSIETRVNSLRNQNASTTPWDEQLGVAISVVDEATNLAISFRPYGIVLCSRSINDIIGSYNYEFPGYHTVRFELLANSMNGVLYVDSKKVLDVTLLGYTGEPSSLWFGDGSSGSEGEAYWDYFAINTRLSGPTNSPPVAKIEGDGLVHVGSTATLSGAGSFDPDGDLITYKWTPVSAPTGSNASLLGSEEVNCSFQADALGEYQVQLVVTDSKGLTSIPVTKTLNTSNAPPVSIAGLDQAILMVGSTVDLDGTQSYDDDGDTLGYSWSMVSRPAESKAVINAPTLSKPFFVADIHGEYVIQLVVSDKWSSSSPNQLLVSFNNVKPVANAGNNQSGVAGDLICLNGAGTDANGDSLSYSWSIVSTPTNVIPVLTNPSLQNTCFNSNAAGTYIASLIVNDGFVNSDTSNVSIGIISSQTAATDNLQKTITIINSIDDMYFYNKGGKKSYTNRINAALGNIVHKSYDEAIGQLEGDLYKIDGCMKDGTPHSHDLINSCSEQVKVYPLIKEAIDYLKRL
jgi:hypothetical protein